MYNLKDQSYLLRPKKMSLKTRDKFFAKLAAHVEQHTLQDIVVFMHGGEPLLVGKSYFQDWVAELRRTVGAICNVIVIVQTNGMLLDDEWIEIFHRFGIRAGISLDGPKRFHDEHRITRRGKGTFDKVMSALECLRDHPLGESVFGSILTVANPEVPPRELWDTWLSTGFSRFDFNLPHCSYESPPFFEIDSLTPWLIELFDIWWAKDDPSVDVRFFRNIVHLILGARSSTDYIGGTQVGIVVIETDGSIQGTDALRACEHGLTNVNMDVFNHEIQDAMAIPLVRDCNHGAAALCETCKSCDVREVCGGGYFPHRYSRTNRFDNPSVYCRPLYAIISHIRNRILSDSNGLFDFVDSERRELVN